MDNFHSQNGGVLFLMKSKNMSEAQFLELLQKVLPKATSDARVASTIYDEVAQEIRLIHHLSSLEAFCAEGSLPNLEPATVAEFRNQLETNFGATAVSLEPTEKGDSMAIQIALPDRTITNKLRVQEPGTEVVEEVKPPMVPYPVSLPEDPDLLWILARREDLAPDDAARALASIEEEFWGTKAGLRLQQKGCEKTFAEFIARVPAGALVDSGLKRHYKEPEPRQELRRTPPKSQSQTEAELLTALA